MMISMAIILSPIEKVKLQFNEYSLIIHNNMIFKFINENSPMLGLKL